MTHEDACSPGLLGEAWAQAGLQTQIFRPYQDVADLPQDLAGYAALIVLGGQMSANSENDHPWLAPTRTLLADAVRAQLPTLGICLGHQLLASALGGTVRVNELGPRIGLTSVALTESGQDDPLLGSPVARRGVHWNEDIVTDLPSGAVRLATAPDGTVQAARFAPRAWGVQFHPEVTEAIFREWATDYPDRSDLDVLGDSVADAEQELRTTWTPLAVRFAALLGRASSVGTS